MGRLHLRAKLGVRQQDETVEISEAHVSVEGDSPHPREWVEGKEGRRKREAWKLRNREAEKVAEGGLRNPSKGRVSKRTGMSTFVEITPESRE